jgi:hypothetical protein
MPRPSDEQIPCGHADLVARYAAQPVPRPAARDTAQLIERLLSTEAPASAPRGDWALRPLAAILVARWRLRLLGPAFWLSGVILVALAGALTPATLRYSIMLPLVLIGPLTAALGVAHALRTTSRGLREIEASAPLSLAEVASGLALALVTFDVSLCVAVSAGLALLRIAPFAALVASWLGPLLFLAGVSLPVAVRYGARAAALVGAGPWALLALWAIAQPHTPIMALYTLPADTPSILGRLLAGLIGLALLLGPLAPVEAWRTRMTASSH